MDQRPAEYHPPRESKSRTSTQGENPFRNDTTPRIKLDSARIHGVAMRSHDRRRGLARASAPSAVSRTWCRAGRRSRTIDTECHLKYRNHPASPVRTTVIRKLDLRAAAEGELVYSRMESLHETWGHYGRAQSLWTLGGDVTRHRVPERERGANPTVPAGAEQVRTARSGDRTNRAVVRTVRVEDRSSDWGNEQSEIVLHSREAG